MLYFYIWAVQMLVILVFKLLACMLQLFVMIVDNSVKDNNPVKSVSS